MILKKLLLLILLLQLFPLNNLKSQIRYNFGFTGGQSISGIAENSFSNDWNFEEGKTLQSWNRKKKTFHLLLGVFGEATYENFSFRLGLNRFVTGEFSSYRTHLLSNDDQSIIQENYLKREFSLEYLQIPAEFEIRFIAFKVHSFILLGFSPAFRLNEYYLEVQAVDDDISWVQGLYLDSFIGVFSTIPEKSTSAWDNSLILGAGFYLHPKISLSTYFYKGRKKVFCPDSDGIHACGANHNNRSLIIQLRYHLQDQY